jgi:hypothetical protein
MSDNLFDPRDFTYAELVAWKARLDEINRKAEWYSIKWWLDCQTDDVAARYLLERPEFLC